MLEYTLNRLLSPSEGKDMLYNCVKSPHMGVMISCWPYTRLNPIYSTYQQNK